MRKSLLIAAVIVLALAVGVETASRLVAPLLGSPAPGFAIPVLVALDAALLARFLLTALGSLVSGSIQGKVDGIATFVTGLCLLLFGIVSALSALALLGFMLGLFLAIPFGTIAYLALFGSFSSGAANAVLSLGMSLKAASMVLFVLWNLHVLRDKSTVLLALTCLLMTGLTSLLIGVVPGFLASITDAVGAIILGIVSVIWGVTLALFSLPSIFRALRGVVPV